MDALLKMELTVTMWCKVFALFMMGIIAHKMNMKIVKVLTAGQMMVKYVQPMGYLIVIFWMDLIVMWLTIFPKHIHIALPQTIKHV